MDKVNQAGKKIGAINKTSGANARRASENFLKPGQIVNSFNKIHPYVTEFTTTPGSPARLNLKIVELPTPCTVNPPLLNISTNSSFLGDNPGEIVGLYDTTEEIDPPNKDFLLVGGAIQVPLDGCYAVDWRSGAWGVGYFGDKAVSVVLLHNTYRFRTVVQRVIGVMALLGPLIYTYAAASPVYALIPCAAGDTISAILTENNIDQGYPWIGGDLGGFFTGDSSLKVTLVAEAEASL
jgi:hypothetical protein